MSSEHDLDGAKIAGNSLRPGPQIHPPCGTGGQMNRAPRAANPGVSMTPRERILAVYRGETPDVVPCMLDLSHWFYHRFRQPWDLSVAYLKPEHELIAYHRRWGVGFYLPNLASFFNVTYDNGVVASVRRADRESGPEITWKFETPLGTISRVRKWEEGSYSWAIASHGLKTEQDLKVLGYALGSRQFTPAWERYHEWVREVGDLGVVYVCPGYSAMGELLSLWMGIEGTMFAAADWPATLHAVVEQINTAWLRQIDLLAQSPAEIVLLGDNFSSDVQSPRFFNTWSRSWYAEAVRRLHATGKYVAVHVDGRLRGLLRAFAELGVDCIDATTPKPMGDLTPGECRSESGPRLILSGGIAPNLWTPDVPEAAFEQAVKDWLALRQESPLLIANAGDQVPPGACEHRISRLRELVEEFGRY
jgi:hypothetical protein